MIVRSPQPLGGITIIIIVILIGSAGPSANALHRAPRCSSVRSLVTDDDDVVIKKYIKMQKRSGSHTVAADILEQLRHRSAQSVETDEPRSEASVLRAGLHGVASFSERGSSVVVIVTLACAAGVIGVRLLFGLTFRRLWSITGN